MRIVCLIESLKPGGAERQLCNIAVGLKQKGLDVRFVTYAPGEFYAGILDKAGVKHVVLRSSSRQERFSQIRKYLRTGNQDIVLAFLPAAATWAILSGLPRRKWGLVVSERLALPKSDRQGWRARLYGWADLITTNSHANRLILEDLNPSLRGKIVTVYNSVDLVHFSPSAEGRDGRMTDRIRLVSVGTMVRKKNIVHLIEAVALVRKERPELGLELHWYGSHPPGDSAAFQEAVQKVDGYVLKDVVRIHEATPDISAVYRQADALIHPSFYEGLPNTVCEGMASGLPILLSNVCDAGNLVISGKNGFLFDPASKNDIASAIINYYDLPNEEKHTMRLKSRKIAEYLFNPTIIIDKYSEILSKVFEKTNRSIDHWPPEVPETARNFLLNK